MNRREVFKVLPILPTAMVGAATSGHVVRVDLDRTHHPDRIPEATPGRRSIVRNKHKHPLTLRDGIGGSRSLGPDESAHMVVVGGIWAFE